MSPDIAVPDGAARIRNWWRLSGSVRFEMWMLMIRSGLMMISAMYLEIVVLDGEEGNG